MIHINKFKYYNWLFRTQSISYHQRVMKLIQSYVAPRSFNFIFLFVFLASFATTMAQNNPNEKKWTQLFNGKDLLNWNVKIFGHDVNDNYGNTFRIEDGKIKISYDEYEEFGGKFGFLFHREKFSYYTLAVEYRFVGEPIPGAPDWVSPINSGVMFHAQSPHSMGENQTFPISIAIQLRGAAGSETIPTANLCPLGTVVELNGKPATEDCIMSRSRTYPENQWVRMEVNVLGGTKIEHIVEGTTVMTYTNPRILQDERDYFDPNAKADETVLEDGTLLERGYIALQSESHPIEFRKIELLNLMGCTDPQALNYKSYYAKSDNSQCKYYPSDKP